MVCCDQEFYKAVRANMKALEGSRRKRNKQMVLSSCHGKFPMHNTQNR
jgi:hypothetical protein